MQSYQITLNDKSFQVEAPADMPLLWAIRDVIGLTGTKYGCGMALCGACSVLMDGVPIRSCATPISSVQGKRLTTIEGLEGKHSEAVQKAWQQLSVPQCGYCQSGQIIAATALLRNNPKPSDQDIDNAMSGHICRCGTYADIRRAIQEAAQDLAKS